MAATVNVPGIGPVKKPILIGGIAVTGGILAFAYYRRSRLGAAAPAAAAPVTAAEPITGDDLAQASDAAGYNTIYPPAQAQFSPYGYDIYGNPLPAPTGAAGASGVYSTNSDWAGAAESALENGGVTLDVSTLAISRVLGGLTVTSQQRDYFMQAVGLLGPPPQGYPQPIKLVDTSTGPPTAPPGSPLPAPTGVAVTSTTKTTVGLKWQPVSGAAHYRVYDNVSSYNIGDSIDTLIRVGGLRSNTTFHFHVRAVSSTGTLGAASSSVSAKTKK